MAGQIGGIEWLPWDRGLLKSKGASVVQVKPGNPHGCLNEKRVLATSIVLHYEASISLIVFEGFDKVLIFN